MFCWFASVCNNIIARRFLCCGFTAGIYTIAVDDFDHDTSFFINVLVTLYRLSPSPLSFASPDVVSPAVLCQSSHSLFFPFPLFLEENLVKGVVQTAQILLNIARQRLSLSTDAPTISCSVSNCHMRCNVSVLLTLRTVERACASRSVGGSLSSQPAAPHIVDTSFFLLALKISRYCPALASDQARINVRLRAAQRRLRNSVPDASSASTRQKHVALEVLTNLAAPAVHVGRSQRVVLAGQKEGTAVGPYDVVGHHA